MLDSLQLPELKNSFCKETGIDSLKRCLDKNYFKNYPYNVEYSYNERGFRDNSWPSDNLKDVIWCVGDSFTVGLGAPFEHTWPQILMKNTNSKVVSVAMDGASNIWINRKVKNIIEEVEPKNIVIMWSYLQRRELKNKELTDMQRRLWTYVNQNQYIDYINFKKCLQNLVNFSKNTNLIHLTVPEFYSKYEKYPLALHKIKNFLGEVKVLDYARDSHHFDILTSNEIVKSIIPLLST